MTLKLSKINSTKKVVPDTLQDQEEQSDHALSSSAHASGEDSDKESGDKQSNHEGDDPEDSA